MSRTLLPNERIGQFALALVAVSLAAPLLAAPLLAAPLLAGDVYTPPPAVRTAAPAFEAATGTAFDRALAAPVPGASWSGVPLREILRQIPARFGVAVLLDGRLDPTVQPVVTVSGESLRSLLEQLATATAGEVRAVGNVVWIGPPDAAAVLRTLAEQRRLELTSGANRRLAARRVVLQRGQTLAWGDLTAPERIVQEAARQFGLTVENIDAIPPDLWAAAVLPEMTAADALSVLLISYDLTFEWGTDLTTVRLVPLPENRETITVERLHTPRGLTPAAAASAWPQEYPALTATVAGRQLRVVGTVEQHEALDAPDTAPVAGGAASPVPLARRRLTLTVTNVPAKAIMDKLGESGIDFVFDASLADVLSQPVSMSVRDATADEFFRALFEPLDVLFTLDGSTVRLRRKP